MRSMLKNNRYFKILLSILTLVVISVFFQNCGSQFNLNLNSIATVSDLTSTDDKKSETEDVINELDPIVDEPYDKSGYYVSPAGNDQNSGLINRPWRTIEKANITVKAGDVVTFVAGEYVGRISPKQSGTQALPIVYRSQSRHAAILLGASNISTNKYTVDINQKNNIVIEGFKINPNLSKGSWARISNSYNVEINDCWMQMPFTHEPFLAFKTNNVRLINNLISGDDESTAPFNMVKFSESENILVEGNEIRSASHSPLQFYPDQSDKNIVVRGNVFRSQWGRNFEFFGSKNVLLERNVIAEAFAGAHSASAGAKVLFEDGIFRWNRVVNNDGKPLDGVPYRATIPFKRVKFYNNVFSKNDGPGILIGGAQANANDFEFINNVFLNNEADTGFQVKSNLSLGTYNTKFKIIYSM